MRKEALFALPSFAFIFLLLLIPLAGTFYLSFFRYTTFIGKDFNFPENYIRLFEDPVFIKSLLFTLQFTILSVSLELVSGLLTGLIIHSSFPGRGILRGLVLLPWAIPGVVSARAWESMFNYSYGLLNYLTDSILGLRINWLGNELTALLSVAVADLWKTTPFVALIILAGLQSIPEDLYKQAKVDGAGIFRRFREITLPLIGPFILVAIVFRTVDALRVFDLVFVLTEGGPGGSTTPLSLYAYRIYLGGDLGYGSAVSVSLFLISLTVSFLLLLISRRRHGFE